MNSFNYKKIFLTCFITLATQCHFTCFAAGNSTKNHCSPIQHKKDNLENVIQEALDAISDISLKEDVQTPLDLLQKISEQALIDRSIPFKDFCASLDAIIKNLDNYTQKLQLLAKIATNLPMQHEYTTAAQKFTFIAKHLEIIKNLFKKLEHKYTNYKTSNPFTRPIKYLIYFKEVTTFKNELDKKTGNKFLPLRFIKKYKALSIKQQLETFIPTLNHLFNS